MNSTRRLGLLAAYLLSVAGAVLLYLTHAVPFGTASVALQALSWVGGVLFVLIVHHLAPDRTATMPADRRIASRSRFDLMACELIAAGWLTCSGIYLLADPSTFQGTALAAGTGSLLAYVWLALVGVADGLLLVAYHRRDPGPLVVAGFLLSVHLATYSVFLLLDRPLRSLHIIAVLFALSTILGYRVVQRVLMQRRLLQIALSPDR